MKLTFTISGQPVSSKNSIRVGITKDGRKYTYKTKQVKEYKEIALKELHKQKTFLYYQNWFVNKIRNLHFPVEKQCKITFIFYVQDNRNYDLVNLMQCPLDLLQEAGIIKNDNYKIVHSLDGSRIEIDKDNPRTEIIIKII